MNPTNERYLLRQMYDFPDLNPSCITSPIYPDNTLMGEINKNLDFSIFSTIVKKARFDIKLSEKQSDFTLFVPSDFYLKRKYSKNSLNNIDENLARQILSYSLMKRKLDKNLLQSSPTSLYPTINRSHLMDISTVNGITLLQRRVKVIHWNHLTDNGLIHVVDDLLIPDTSPNLCS
jgi:uncharacterized surface protein with fasciclin (FAS1) repeats